MNKLEQHILEGARKAQAQHYQRTNGFWLWHGPESFLQTVVSQELQKTGHVIYIDTSIKNLLKEIERGPGRPAKYERQRPDISVWHKGLETLRAAIEIKRAMNFNTIRADAKKIERYLANKNAAKTGYVLAYSEVTRKHSNRLKIRFCEWKKKLGAKWTLVGSHVDRSDEDPNWVWGIVLLRYDRHH